jgi:hypothetical protein
VRTVLRTTESVRCPNGGRRRSSLLQQRCREAVTETPKRPSGRPLWRRRGELARAPGSSTQLDATTPVRGGTS